MQTFRRYYDDCYTSLFKAELAELRPPDGTRKNWQVVFDATYFYPASGGQPCDFGTIAGTPVVDVLDQGDVVIHVLRDALPSELPSGSTVDCRLDWPRRYDHMQQHTGQHLLSAVLTELFGWKTLGFHMGDDVSTIELGTSKIEDTQIDVIERRANELVSEGRPIRFQYEEAESVGELRKASARTGTLRIVNINAYDRSACGGTHVRSTAEIGSIQIRNLERVRGNIRLEFVCGGRALRHSKSDFRLLSRLSKAASVSPLSLDEHLTGLRARLDGAEKALAKANLQLAEVEAGRMYEEAPVLADGTRRCVLRVPDLTDTVRATAIAFANRSKGVIAVLPETLPGTVLLACSVDSGCHAGTIWKASFTLGGGRGGGSATLAQGSVSDANALASLMSNAALSI